MLVSCGTTRPDPGAEALRLRVAQHEQLERVSYDRGLRAMLARMELEVARAEHPEAVTFDVLAVHGGGPAAAFAAGFLHGWGRVEAPGLERPFFDIVTGSSSGALVAPFAFVGDEHAYTALLETFCTLPVDLFGSASPFSLWPWRSALLSNRKVAELIRTQVDAAMIGELARGGDEHRQALVATTDLDLGAARIWDLHVEAQRARERGDPSRLHEVLLASTAVPVAFPPVEIDGALHTDGGVSATVFPGFDADGMYAVAERWAERHPDLPMPRLRLWAILNQQLFVEPRVVQPRYLDVALRSVETMMEFDRLKALLYMANMIEVIDGRKGIRAEFRWTAIPQGAPMPVVTGLLDRDELAVLAGVGHRAGTDPSSWKVGEPSQFRAPDEVESPPEAAPSVCPAN